MLHELCGLGDEPGAVGGGAIAWNGIQTLSSTLGGLGLAVGGVTQIAGAATNTDTKEAREALDSVSSVPGLVTAAATGGNLHAASVASTVAGSASLATKPADAVKNTGKALDAANTVKDAGTLTTKVAQKVANFISPPPPPAPSAPSTPPCSVAGACK